jgi:hypothetical protein
MFILPVYFRRSVLDAFASLLHQEQPEGHAARLWAAVTTLREAIGAARPPVAQERFDREVAEARVALGEIAFAVAWDEGRVLTLEQAIEYALGKAA